MPTPADESDAAATADPAERFTRRVADYVRYRPGYPVAVLETLRGWGFLPPAVVVLDVGAGTGISSEPFLAAGHRVFAVEPNAGMRGASLSGVSRRYPEQFQAVDGRAEATTLPDASVDLVVAGQAFHWFEPGAARQEFARVLRPGGAVALLWNERKLDATPFLADYERLLLTFGTDYEAVRDRHPTPAGIAAFFGETAFLTAEFANAQSFDFEGLCGRSLSSSYLPTAESPAHGPMLAALRRLFDRHQEAGKVRFEYRTVLYAAKLER